MVSRNVLQSVCILFMIFCVTPTKADSLLQRILSRYAHVASTPPPYEQNRVRDMLHARHRLRRMLFDIDEDADLQGDDVTVQGLSQTELRTQITEHRSKLTRLKAQTNDLAHERAFLEKTLALKKGQKTMQDGQVRLSQAELEDKAKEIAMYKREAPRTLAKYNELVRTQRAMQQTLNRLHQESEDLSTSKNAILGKIRNLNVEDLVEKHARGLPDALGGALRKSAAALVPFFDYLAIAADTNNRLVDHVGKEIDRWTHVDISRSPFMSGILFYCVLLVPLLTLICFARRIADSSSRWTVSHCILYGNISFIAMCVVNVCAAVLLREDPINVWFQRFERTFIVANLLLGVYYVWHVTMLGVQSVYTREKGDVSQFVATSCVGVHYFLFTWRKVFTDSAPMMYTFNYMLYATIFAFVLYERLNRMTSRQINESLVGKLLTTSMRKSLEKAPRMTWDNFFAYMKQVFPQWFPPPTKYDRRRPILSDRRGKDTRYQKLAQISSEEEAKDDRARKKGESASNKRGRCFSQAKEDKRLMSRWFGTRVREASSEDEEVYLGRARREESGRGGKRAARKERERRDLNSKSSLWKWS